MAPVQKRNRSTKTNRDRRSGSLTEVRPGVWRLRAPLGLDADGDFKQASKTVFTKKRGGRTDALEELAKFVKETRENHPGVGKASTFGKLLTAWLDDLPRQGRSPNTIDTYRIRVEKHVRPALGPIRLGDLTAYDLDKFYAQLAETKTVDGKEVKGLASSTIVQAHAICSGALSQAVKWRWIRENPARFATPPRIENVDRVTLDPQQVVDLIAESVAEDPDMGMLIGLAALTGCRRGELVGFKWSDVDWQKRTIHVQRSLVPAPGGGHREGPPKGRKKRLVAIGVQGVAMLRAYQDRQTTKLGHEPAGWLLSYDGVSPLSAKTVSNYVTALGKRVKVPLLHLHELRHFAATQLVAIGTDPKTVQTILGHSSLDITAGYVHGVSELEQKASDALGELLRLAPTETPALSPDTKE